MNSSSTFGIVIPLGSADIPYVKGLLASLRHFMGGVPICLIYNEEIDVRRLVKLYRINHVISAKDVRNADLFNYSLGVGRTSMIAMWEGPFDHYFKLDADMVIWGNMLDYLPECEKYDFVHTSPYEASTV